MMIEKLDRLFQIVFARYRRKDSNIGWAWKQASSKVLSYVSWALAGVVGALLATFYSMVKIGSPRGQKWSFMIAMLVAVMAVNAWLGRRYGKYQLSPPELPSEETRGDRMFVLGFRVISFGIFVLICTVGYFLNPFGGRFR